MVNKKGGRGRGRGNIGDGPAAQPGPPQQRPAAPSQPSEPQPSQPRQSAWGPPRNGGRGNGNGSQPPPRSSAWGPQPGRPADTSPIGGNGSPAPQAPSWGPPRRAPAAGDNGNGSGSQGAIPKTLPPGQSSQGGGGGGSGNGRSNGGGAGNGRSNGGGHPRSGEGCDRPPRNNGGGDAPREKREKPPPANEIATKPQDLMSKSGKSGTEITITTNYFRLSSKTEFILYHYNVDVPGEDRTIVRKRIVYQHKKDLGTYLFDGTSLFSSHRLPNDVMELTSIYDEKPYPFKIRLVGDVAKGDHTFFQVFNILLRRCIEHLDLQLIRRNYFDPKLKEVISQFRLEVWPGYITSIRQHDGGCLMNVEIAHKVMRTDTYYDMLQECYKKNSNNFVDAFKQLAIGTSAFTAYNNREYRISDVNFEVNPSMTFNRRDGSAISYGEYYKDRYNIVIKDMKQPLLVCVSSAKELRAGRPEFIYLIPELCRNTGMTDSMRSNFSLMSRLAETTRVAPGIRIKKLLQFNGRLQSLDRVAEEFRNWDFKLEKDLVQVPGRLLKAEPIIFGGNKNGIPNKGDFTNSIQDSKAITAVALKQWIVVFPERLGGETQTFIQKLVHFASRTGFAISQPKTYPLRNDSAQSIGNTLTEITSKCSPQMIMVVAFNNDISRYRAVKKTLCLPRGIPSQVIISKNLTPKNPAKLNSIATKVGIQMNCKLGGIPWSVSLNPQHKGLMIVGFDVCHEKVKVNYGALVASMDQNFGRYYSAITKHSEGQELSNDFALHLRNAVLKFRELNSNRLPSRIIIYRDGVGEGQVPFVFTYEVDKVRKMLDELYAEKGPCRMSFIIVTKRLNTRLFERDQNPNPGTIVDKIITDPLKYDFFLVSQSVKQGTVSPTAYNIISDNSQLTPDEQQLLAYKFCHMYYNVSSTVRVPAPCHYAHKLASLATLALEDHAVNQALQTLLYFL